MAETVGDPGKAKPEPLFRLDLGENGGPFSPKSLEELRQWIDEELRCWSWVSGPAFGQHYAAVDQPLNQLRAALSEAGSAQQYKESGRDSAVQEQLTSIRTKLSNAFEHWRLPHSRSPAGKRVKALSESPHAAMAYAWVQIPPQHTTSWRFDPASADAWRGLFIGLSERYGLSGGPGGQLASERAAWEADRAKAHAALEEDSLAAQELHRRFNVLVETLEARTATQDGEHDERIAREDAAHEKLRSEHIDRMTEIERNFSERMALQGPVAYWNRKAGEHTANAGRLLWATRLSMGGLGVGVCVALALLLWHYGTAQPSPWILGLVALIAVLGVWAVRLVIRTYLSERHLATDAAERETMAMTYLALLESKKLPSDDDRKLILTALFRPASDGLVKDEGLPHPLLEALTRSGGR